MKSLIVSQIIASHGVAEKFNKELLAVVEQRASIVQKLEVEAKAEYVKIGKEYSYSVTDASLEPFLPADAKGKAAIRLVRKWTNKAQHDYVRKLFGVAYRDEAETVASAIYYRVNNILVATGKEAQLLKANQQCSDEDWEQITQGIIPRKYLA